MTVQTIPPTPTRAAVNLARKPSLNKRFPPLADRSSLPHRLSGLSRQKLAREATAPDPDVRRCLAHFRLHVASIEWTSKDVNRQISSFELEEEDDDEEDKNENEDEDENEKRNLKHDQNDKGGSHGKADDHTVQPPPSQASPIEVLHVSFEVNDALAQQSPPSKEEGLLERGRSCIEKTVQKKHFWSTSGQCVPVRIAS